METESRARPLGPLALLALGINGIVGVGIFFAPSSVAAELPGTAGVWIYLATAAVMFPIAFGFGALGGRFDVDGGPYVWARAAFGTRFAFFVGWVTYVSSLLSVAAVVSGLAHHAGPLFGVEGDLGIRVLAGACTLALGVVAATGLRLSSYVWSGVTVLKLVPLVVLVAVGVFAYGATPAAPFTPHPVTAHAVERAVLVVVFASQGFEIVPLLAGSVRRSSFSVPFATVASLGFATLLYAVLHVLVAHAVPALESSHAPLADAARIYGGSATFALVAAGANVSALGIAFGMLNTTPRYLSALSETDALGPWIGELDARLVPQRALWITTAVVVVIVSFLGKLTELFVLSSLAVLAQYAVTLASLAVLSVREQHGLRRIHLWPVPLSVIGIALAAQGAEPVEIVVAAVVVFTGELLRRYANRSRDG
ncbi:MAG TPA: APC family permease [Polyangiaceae bacterium]|jgi:amino acid transporter|nr:APC family permease [Polyangiaceae bacterium]